MGGGGGSGGNRGSELTVLTAGRDSLKAMASIMSNVNAILHFRPIRRG